MTEQAAQSWLSSHQNTIPAVSIYHQQALASLEDQSKSVQNLGDIVALDPGMTVSLFQQVNSKLQQGGKEIVGTVHGALVMLGDGVIADLITQHQILDTTHPEQNSRQSYLQLLSRCYHLQAQLEGFIGFQEVSSAREMLHAALLYNIGEYLACLFDYKKYQQYQIQFRIMGNEANSARPVFGFDFHELGQLFAKQNYLPPMLLDTLDGQKTAGRQSRLIQLAADLSHQIEVGWSHSSLKASIRSLCKLSESVGG